MEAEKLNYLMGASVTGNGDDSQRNHCGINSSHAYSILAAFKLKNDAIDEDVLLMRNPWGITGYNKKWNYEDADWTDELVK